jgi:hypothetical protein
MKCYSLLRQPYIAFLAMAILIAPAALFVSVQGPADNEMAIPPKEKVRTLTRSESVVLMTLVVIGLLSGSRYIDTTPGRIAVGLAGLLFVISVWRNIPRPTVPGWPGNRKLSRRDETLQLYFGAFAMFLISGVCAIADVLLRGLNYIFPVQDGNVDRLIAFVAVGLVGGSLYAFRCFSRFLYGLSEVVFALYVAWDRGPQLKQLFEPHTDEALRTATVGIMTGSVYLMVRGLDNAAVGFAASKGIRRLIRDLVRVFLPCIRQMQLHRIRRDRLERSASLESTTTVGILPSVSSYPDGSR